MSTQLTRMSVLSEGREYVHIGAYIPKDVLHELRRRAFENHRTVSGELRCALDRYLKGQFDPPSVSAR